jgi:hypothetical protein
MIMYLCHRLQNLAEKSWATIPFAEDRFPPPFSRDFRYNYICSPGPNRQYRDRILCKNSSFFGSSYCRWLGELLLQMARPTHMNMKTEKEGLRYTTHQHVTANRMSNGRHPVANSSLNLNFEIEYMCLVYH